MNSIVHGAFSTLTLGQYPLALLALHNQLHAPRGPWTGTLAGQSIEVRWGAAAATDTDTASNHCLLALGDEVIRLPVAALPFLPPPTDDPELDAWLLELALLEWLEPLEALLGVPVQVRDEQSTTPATFALNLGLTLAMAGAPEQALQLEMTHSAAVLIADLLHAHARPLPGAGCGVSFSLAAEAGDAWLSLGELRSLQPGDVLMLDASIRSGVRLVLNGVMQTYAERHDERSLRVLEPLNPVNPTLESPMNSPETPVAEDMTLNDLPLKLVCQIGSVELSLAQLQQLGVGSLLQLTTRMDEAVDLMVNGRCVGRGHLVQIGEGLGMRLQSFAKA